MASLDPRLHLGTSSWSSDDWKTAGFYPADMEPRDYLASYARSFDTVEVDSSFYRSPSPQMCARWKSVTPDEFRFSLKIPQSITHEKVLEDCQAEWRQFIGATERLGEKLRFLVLQFAYFNKQSACPSLPQFLKRLDTFTRENPSPVPLVVEVRNRPWIGGELLEFLKTKNLILALTEQEWMPKIGELWKKYGEGLVTGKDVYIRFLGERKRIDALTQTWDKLVIDRTEETKNWIPVTKALLRQGREVWGYFNNHFGGYAPGSIALFRKLWDALRD